MRSPGVIFFAAALAVASVPQHVALADERAAIDTAARAKEHADRASAFKEVGAHSRAIDEYKAAYDAVPVPEYLFQIGECYRAQGDARSAIDYYRRYLERAPDGLHSDEALAQVVALKKLDGDPGVATSTPAPPPTTPPSIAPTSTTDSPSATHAPLQTEGAAATVAAADPEADSMRRNREVAPQPVPDALEPDEPETPKPFWKKWWFWTAVGVVVAGGVAGAVVAILPNNAPIPDSTGGHIDLHFH